MVQAKFACISFATLQTIVAARLSVSGQGNRSLSVSNPVACDTQSCVAPDPAKSNLLKLPCGGSPAEDGQEFVKVFHYGANMGCKKLSKLKVLPVSAMPARVMGRCLHFGVGDHTPTSEKEPAWGTLVTCGDGCVHGVVHEIRKSDLEAIHRTETGYDFVELSEPVVGYNGKRIKAVKAYIMRGQVVERAPSRRYAGLVYCQAKVSLAADYAQQTACRLSKMSSSLDNLNCEQEEFEPLVDEDSSVSEVRFNALLLFVIFMYFL